MTREADRLHAHAVVISSPVGYHSNALEISYALAELLFVPRHNITVSKYSLDFFLAEFKSFIMFSSDSHHFFGSKLSEICSIRRLVSFCIDAGNDLNAAFRDRQTSDRGEVS
jgi:hypothetical protein